MYEANQSLSYEKVNYHVLWIMWLAKNKHYFSAYGKGKELLPQKKLHGMWFSADHYEMPYLLSTGQIIDTRTWKMSILLSFVHCIKPMPLQNGPPSHFKH
jgi:hypothetical protein